MTKAHDRMLRYFARSLACAMQHGMAERDTSTAQLSKQVGESTAFLQRILIAEDEVARNIKVSTIAAIAAELGCKPQIHFVPCEPVKSSDDVKSEDETSTAPP